MNGARTITFDSKTGHLFDDGAGARPGAGHAAAPADAAAAGRRDSRLVHDSDGREVERSLRVRCRYLNAPQVSHS